MNDYKILNIPDNSSKETIKQAYRQLSKQYHPDINPDGLEQYKAIVEAYHRLMKQPTSVPLQIDEQWSSLKNAFSKIKRPS